MIDVFGLLDVFLGPDFFVKDAPVDLPLMFHEIEIST